MNPTQVGRKRIFVLGLTLGGGFGRKTCRPNQHFTNWTSAVGLDLRMPEMRQSEESLETSKPIEPELFLSCLNRSALMGDDVARFAGDRVLRETF